LAIRIEVMRKCGWNNTEVIETLNIERRYDTSDLPTDYTCCVEVLYVVGMKKKVKKGHGNLRSPTSIRSVSQSNYTS